MERSQQKWEPVLRFANATRQEGRRSQQKHVLGPRPDGWEPVLRFANATKGER